MKRKEKITPCLWFNGGAEDAAMLYCSMFDNAKVVARSPYVVELDINGQRLTLLEGGPKYKPNASISLYCHVETEKEVNRIWNSLVKEGTVLVKLDKYPWSALYGFVTDKYGVAWQVGMGKFSDVGQQVTPCLMFTGKQCGRAEEALNFYAAVFKEAKTDGILYNDTIKKQVDHAQFSLLGQKFMVMDSGDSVYPFTEGVSLTIHCDNQEEIDYYWTRLTESGAESMCGWLRDRFGVSWQVVPTILDDIMKDPVKAGKAAKAFMAMRKLEIEQIVQASLA